MKKLVFLSLFIVFLGNVFAQNTTITGTVSSNEDGTSLPGVSIIVKGTTQGTITDINGNYSITVPENAILMYSFLGYKSQEIEVNRQTVIDIALEVDVTDLDEVVVVGYGVQKKSVVTGAIAKVDADEIMKSAPVRVEQALQGKTAGVQITSNSGQPGDGLTVRIRGIGTTGNSDPVYIVDGMPVGGIDYLNPSDIESVQVLKDASATAIYGARGANGVVLITTKQGSAGKMKISYDGYVGFQNPWKKVSLLDAEEYAIIMNESYANDNAPIPFPDVTAITDSVGTGTDWQDALFYENAPMVSHQITASGGTEHSTFLSSFSYLSQDGIVAQGKSNYERYTYRINANHNFGKFNMGNNIAFSQKITRGISPNEEFAGPLSRAVNIDPITPVYMPDGSFAQSSFASQEIVNPMAALDVLNSEYKENKFVGNVWGEYEFTEGLKLRSSLSIDLAYGMDRAYIPVYDLGGNAKTSVSEANATTNKWFTWQNENVLSYTKSIGLQNFTVLAGMTINQYRHEFVGGRKTDLLFEDFDNAWIDTGTDEESYKAWGGADEHALQSYFGRLNYNFDEKYLFEAVIRADGSSNFGPNNKYGYFPAFSGGWVVTKESFMESMTALNFLKLRAGWGQNGNEAIGAFQYTSVIGSGSKYTFGDGETIYTGSNPTSIPNPDLKWETSEQINLGVDARLLSNRLSVTLDFYDKTTRDLLVQAPIPGYVGNAAPTVNGGNVKNTGLEIELGYKDTFGDLKFAANLTGGFNNNEVTAINNSEGKIYGAGLAVGMTNINMAEVGYPIAYFWGYETAGVFQTDEQVLTHVSPNGVVLQPDAKAGDLIWVNNNGDDVIDDKDRTMIGNPYPDFTAGLSINMEFKGFDFNMFWYGAFGQEIFNGTRRYDLPMMNWEASVLERWTGEGTSNSHPRVTTADPNQNYFRVSDFYIEDGSYLRLKNLTLGYTLPKQILDVAKIESLRFYITANNLLTFTQYSGFDPEIGANWALDVGIDRNIYPQPRTILMGVNVNF